MQQSIINKDNQQEFDDVKELSWLGGGYDCDGCISMIPRIYRKNLSLTIYISFTNTRNQILDEVIRILKKYNIPYHISYKKAKGKQKQRQVITVAGYKRAYKLATLIQPYIRGKKVQIDNMVKLLISRLIERKDLYKRSYIKLPGQSGFKGSANRNNFTLEEIEWIREYIIDKNSPQKEHHLKLLRDYQEKLLKESNKV